VPGGGVGVGVGGGGVGDTLGGIATDGVVTVITYTKLYKSMEINPNPINMLINFLPFLLMTFPPFD